MIPGDKVVVGFAVDVVGFAVVAVGSRKTILTSNIKPSG